MGREPPLSGENRRKPMQTRVPKKALQLELLLNSSRITKLDTRSRVVVVRLLARLLLDAVRRNERAAADDKA
jgi:hypothetical protein